MIAPLNWIEAFFLWYFSAVNVVCLLFLLIGSIRIYSRHKELRLEDLSSLLQSESLPEISFIVPMYNEQAFIHETIQNVLRLSYRYKQLIVVNDGSTDDSMQIIHDRFDLVEIPTYFEPILPTAEIRKVYRSRSHPELYVIDKAHKGKFDAVNAGINACTNAYFISIDADTVIDNEGFEALIRPLLAYPETVAVGVSVRIKNGCTVEYNRISTQRFPKNFLPAMQDLEYMRSFLVRGGWDAIQGNFVIAGAFSVFPRKLILEVGGLCPSVAEDMEIIVRLQRLMRVSKTPFKIFYIPDPVAWTEGPSTVNKLGRQRTRWHLGLLETIWYHKALVFNPRFGSFGLFCLPYWIFGEALEPLVEVAGYAYICYTFWIGTLNLGFLLLLFLVGFAFIFLFTLSSIFVEELTFRKYPSLRTLLSLSFYSMIENFGYRQMTLWWRVRAFGVFCKQFAKVRRDKKDVLQRVHTALKNYRL